MGAPQPVSFRWHPEFVQRIDAARGLVPRSAFVRAAVERVLDPPKVTRPKKRVETPRGRVETPLNRAEMFRRATQRHSGSVGRRLPESDDEMLR